MPGGRLTHQDRQHIASGLAAGLGYAEIARQLGRPTSTISREVARNGGAHGYRADHAHLATGRRARRRTPLPRTEIPAVLTAHGRDPETVRRFNEQFADLMARAGLARMTARVLTCLFTTDSRSLTAAELVQYLHVSPASISKAIGHLEELELVRRERDPGKRRERYVVDDDVWLRAWSASGRKNATFADVAQRGVEILGPATPAGARLKQMGMFFAKVSEDITGGTSAAELDDAMTVLAALLHAGAPLTAHQLATALEWPSERVGGALRDAGQRPDITDPVALRSTESGAYTVAPLPDRLTGAQRRALSSIPTQLVGEDLS